MDVRDLRAVEAAMHECDAVVHLAGIPEEAEWERIHEVNLVGTYNTFEAARRAGVSRVVFASSNHVIGFYRRNRRVGPDAPPRPDTRYGVSKAFGEALGRLYADKYRMEIVCLRIGSFRPKPLDVRMLSTWISPRDTVELVARALEAPGIRFEVVYGVSANTRGWWDNPGAETIGFRPVDNAEDFAAEILSDPTRSREDEVAALFHGGAFCSVEFAGRPEEVE